MPSLNVRHLRTGTAAYFLAAVLALACAAFFFVPGRRGAREAPAPAARTSIRAGYYSYKSRLLASQFGLTGSKNKIEKRLESRFLPNRYFGPKDADELLKTCVGLDPLLLEMSAGAHPQPYLSQIAAARAAALQLTLEAAKLKSLIKGSGQDSARILRQLSVVERGIDRLQTHIEGLAR